MSCRLPSKSLCLNLIEPEGVEGKRVVVSPDRLLTAHALAEEPVPIMAGYAYKALYPLRKGYLIVHTRVTLLAKKKRKRIVFMPQAETTRLRFPLEIGYLYISHEETLLD